MPRGCASAARHSLEGSLPPKRTAGSPRLPWPRTSCAVTANTPRCVACRPAQSALNPGARVFGPERAFLARGPSLADGASLAELWCMQTQPIEKRCLNGDRVREHTAPGVTQRIDRMSAADVDAAVGAGPDAILQRLVKLDYEWDVDRALMVAFAIAGGASFTTGLLRYTRSNPLSRRRKGFLYLFGTQLGFLFLHGVVGWCPPAVVLRRLGFRTQREIEAERRDLRDALALSKAD